MAAIDGWVLKVVGSQNYDLFVEYIMSMCNILYHILYIL